jgi:site-specific DNA recombinase
MSDGATQNEKKTKVALYARVSTDEQRDKGFSLAGQMELLRAHASRYGYEVHDEYVDGGYSGTSLDRPQFQRLLADARKKCFELVLVYKIDRFFRNNKALLTIAEELEQVGVGIRSITEPFDTSNYIGKFSLSLFGSLAQLERDTLLERSKMGRLRRAKEGYYSGASPAKFGYQYNKQTRKLEINEPEAKTVALIFHLYNQPDASCVNVVRRLRALGLRTKEGKQFESSSVHEILKDVTYTGTWYANRYSKGGKLKPREQWIEVKVPEIIPRELFESTQQLLESRRNHSRRNAKRDYLLQGLVKCGDCGNSLAGTADKQFQVKNGKSYGPYLKLYYRCTHFVKNRLEKLLQCRLRYIRAEVLESVVWKEVDKLLAQPELIQSLVKQDEVLSEKSRRNLEDELSQLAARQQGLLKEEQRVLEAYRQGAIEIEQLKQQIDGIRKEKAASENRRMELRKALQQPNNAGKEVNHAIDFLRKLSEGFETFSIDAKRKVLELLDASAKVSIDGKVALRLVLPTSPAVDLFQPAFLQRLTADSLPHFEPASYICW